MCGRLATQFDASSTTSLCESVGCASIILWIIPAGHEHLHHLAPGLAHDSRHGSPPLLIVVPSMW